MRGGFHERLNGTEALDEPRRARVQPRQSASFARARELGWSGDAARLVTHGLDYLFKYYRRDDGLFCTLIASDGTQIDHRALLYDHAFALFALAESHRVIESPAHYREEALRLRSLIHQLLKPGGAAFGPGFETGLPLGMARCSNPHMHLLEACLAWQEAHGDATWQSMADEIVELALSRFIDPDAGILREHFQSDWTPLPGLQGRIIEPGHHFEWAWLLMRWAGDSHPEVRPVALRLIEIGERYGVRDGVALNGLLDDFSVHDAGARLWPQTERLKAAVRAAHVTGEERYWEMAASAAEALLRYLEIKPPGLWYDRLTPDGRFLPEPAPASSFYHLVVAIAELKEVAA